MRLIDADKLPYVNKVILVDDVDGDITITVAKEHTSYVNDETPTVKAVPIEWIRNYVSIWISEPYKNFALNMITKWEKENEID